MALAVSTFPVNSLCPARLRRQTPVVRWRARLALPRLLAGLVLALGTGFAGQSTASPTPLVATRGSLADLQTQVEAQRREVEQLETRQRQVEQAQRRREAAAESLVAEIERLKAQPEGVARDLALNEKLAQSQAQATTLSREGAALRQGTAELRTARQRLVALCDRLLLSDVDSSLSAAQRLIWLRLRTQQVEALLAGPQQTQPAAVVGSATAAMSAATAASATVDDPQVLREQADLLRDSVDKLRREVDRLAGRSEELRRRERLRERASRVDEDLFAEQATARRRGSSAAQRGGAEAAAPAADTAGGVLSTSPPTTGGTFQGASPTRSGPDPSTLDALLRSEGAGDPATKQQALQRARTELEALAGDLLRRAAQLEQRASDLGKQK